MKRRVLAGILCLLTMCSTFFAVSPKGVIAKSDAISEAQTIIDDIVDFKLSQTGAASIEEWIDGELSNNAGITSEWYIIALSQSGSYDFSAYQAALKNYLDKNEVRSASSRLKYALALIATGSADSYISETLDNSIDGQGVMSFAYGLHLLNNGYTSSSYAISEVKQALISLQLADGGWAIRGESGDVDVTAMVVQALAPHYENDASVCAAIDKALTLLASRQLEDGGYSSYGVANPESAAQVITALAALGINCEEDKRFIKAGNTLFDVLKKYQLSDGSFCHTEGGSFNENATVQCFYSATEYIRMMQGKGSLYILDNRNPAGLSGAEQPTMSVSEAEQLTDNNTQKVSYKLWVSLGIVVLALAICIILFATKKKNKKNFIVVSMAALLAIGFVIITDFKSTEDYYNSEGVTKENVVGTVTMTIRCDTVVGKSEAEYIPDDGIVLDTTSFQIDEDDTVYDILIEAAKMYNIHIENDGASGMAYIVGINYLYEFDFGDLSGWLYYVNGEEASMGCDKYVLADGDVIEWHYSCELGNDLD